jgi:hypothetical protein
VQAQGFHDVGAVDGDGPQEVAIAPLRLGAYATHDLSLDSAFGLLPLPLPFCSVRIQYSGAPGTVIGEVSSVEAKGDLIIDSRLANERDGWAGSGAHPWRLDEETESIMFLTNMGERPARIGFDVVAGGTHYYLTRLKLQPRETRAIDLRKLRDEQKPDFRKNRIPINATDGSVLWSRLDNVPIMGRLVVLQRHKGIASNYDCYICDCTADYVALAMDPSSLALLVDGTWMWETRGKFQEHCNTYYWWIDVDSSFVSANPAIASTTYHGLVTGRSGGQTTITATHTDLYYTYSSTLHECVEHERTRSTGGQANVATISGPQTVWWFNGQTPSGYATTITLTAQPSGASSYSWSLLAGTDKAALQNQSGNTIQVRSNDLSTSTNDVTVQATVTTAGGTKSATRTLTVRGPRLLTYSTRIDSEDPEFGYASHIFYKIRDNLNELLPLPIGFNEKWTTGMVNDYAGTSWTRGPVIGATTSNSELDDLIQGQGLGGSPIPVPVAPQYPFGTTKVQHWGQEHRVGNTAPGTGVRVQINTFQKYRDHASHESIQSPAP